MRERKYLTFDMSNARHVKALEIFAEQSDKSRSEYVINCILREEEENRLEQLLRKVLSEMLHGANFNIATVPLEILSPKATTNKSELPKNLISAMDFAP